MIIIQVAGGLGNQMQQYAMYRKLLSLGKEAKLDISWFTQEERQDKVYAKRQLELAYFDNLPFESCTEAEKKALIGDGSLFSKIKGKLLPGTKKLFQETDMYHPEIFDFEDMYLCGYFACEKYYADILEELRADIKFPVSENPENLRLAKKMQEEESVSIHIRRGDYLDPENAAMFGGICTEGYYNGAIKEMKRLYPQAHFYIFSDDAGYARARYNSEEYTVVDVNHGKDSFYDIWLMSRCKHNICANSTFSFWGARLNGNANKVMIRPSIHKNSQTYEPVRMHDLWKNWVLIDKVGEIV